MILGPAAHENVPMKLSGCFDIIIKNLFLENRFYHEFQIDLVLIKYFVIFLFIYYGVWLVITLRLRFLVSIEIKTTSNSFLYRF